MPRVLALPVYLHAESSDFAPALQEHSPGAQSKDSEISPSLVEVDTEEARVDAVACTIAVALAVLQ